MQPLFYEYISEKVFHGCKIARIDYRLAMDIVVANHYLHRRCPVSRAYGLVSTKDNELVGVITYGIPCSNTLLRGIAGNDESDNVYELNRLWVSDTMPKNTESFFVANTIKDLDKEIIVSFADTEQGHIGYIYQACNFLYCGMSAPFLDPHVKGKEHQHIATFAHGLTNRQVVEKYGEEKVYFVQRSRKHRYIYFNAGRLRKKHLMKKLRYKILPYPKGKNNE